MFDTDPSLPMPERIVFMRASHWSGGGDQSSREMLSVGISTRTADNDGHALAEPMKEVKFAIGTAGNPEASALSIAPVHVRSIIKSLQAYVAAIEGK